MCVSSYFVYLVFWFVSLANLVKFHSPVLSLKQTARTCKFGWLEDDHFLLGPGLFSGAILVWGRIITNKNGTSNLTFPGFVGWREFGKVTFVLVTKRYEQRLSVWAIWDPWDWHVYLHAFSRENFKISNIFDYIHVISNRHIYLNQSVDLYDKCP